MLRLDIVLRLTGSLCAATKPERGNQTGLFVGYETSCGDPLFMDVRASELPVFTARHGEGAWEPFQVASSVQAFAKCVAEFSRISAGRSNPAQRDANPITDGERIAFLGRIAEVNQASSAPEFWGVLLDC
jgi:hypothetical protein